MDFFKATRAAVAISIFAAWACGNGGTDRLPILGERTYETVVRGGIEQTDTMYHTIPEFAFLDQDSTVITHGTFVGKVYIADFFFTRCPTICPITARNMLTLAKHFEAEPRVLFVSHTIDTKFDTPAILKAYATKLGAPKNWLFLTGRKADIYQIAGQQGYFSFAEQNRAAPGGFDHSGAFTLVDEHRRVRGLYDGTITDSIPAIIADIERLLQQG